MPRPQILSGSQLGCKMFCSWKHWRKGNMRFVQLLEKMFVVTAAARQQKIIFLTSPQLRKSVKILSIQWKTGSNIQKTHTAKTSPTRVDIAKTKHTTSNPANISKVTTRGTTTRDTNKQFKGNGTYKKVRNA